jgi:oleandomycin transport system ATP-binding protein
VLQVSPADPGRMAEVIALMAGLIRGEVVTRAAANVATGPVADPALLPHIFRELDDSGIELAEFTLRKASLDEVFFALTGHRAEDEETGRRELECSNR